MNHGHCSFYLENIFRFILLRFSCSSILFFLRSLGPFLVSAVLFRLLLLPVLFFSLSLEIGNGLRVCAIRLDTACG